jgi:hypothetical protein
MKRCPCHFDFAPSCLFMKCSWRKYRYTGIAACLVLLIPVSGLTQQQEQTRDQSKARIVTSQGQAEECISPLAVTRIDGGTVVVSHKAFEIEPGIHRLNGRTTMNMRHCQPLRGEDRMVVGDLEEEFEAGKSYFVGFDHSDADKNEWKLVVWLVEEG